MTREEAIRWLTQDYCCNRAVCELHSQNLCQTETCEIWMAKKALEEPERKTGQWIEHYGDSKCSECGYILKIYDTNYCPNCGADMRGEQEWMI